MIKLPPHSQTIETHWQPNSYIILHALNKKPHAILPHPPAARSLHHFTPTEQKTSSLVQHFTPRPTLHQFVRSRQITPVLHYSTPWQPVAYFILPRRNELPLIVTCVSSYRLTQLAFCPLGTKFLHHLSPIGSLSLTACYPL